MAPVFGSSTTTAELAKYGVWSNLFLDWHQGFATGWLDFDNDGLIDIEPVAVNLDFSSFGNDVYSASQNDWEGHGLPRRQYDRRLLPGRIAGPG